MNENQISEQIHLFVAFFFTQTEESTKLFFERREKLLSLDEIKNHPLYEPFKKMVNTLYESEINFVFDGIHSAHKIFTQTYNWHNAGTCLKTECKKRNAIQEEIIISMKEAAKNSKISLEATKEFAISVMELMKHPKMEETAMAS